MELGCGSFVEIEWPYFFFFFFLFILNSNFKINFFVSLMLNLSI
jgi:hypothetical protein